MKEIKNPELQICPGNFKCSLILKGVPEFQKFWNFSKKIRIGKRHSIQHALHQYEKGKKLLIANLKHL